MQFPRLLRTLVAASTLVAVTAEAVAADYPVFRWRTSLAGGGLPPGGGGDGEPETPPPAPDPLAGPTTHLRVTVASFGTGTPGALSELAFTNGTTRLAPTTATISGNAGTGDANAFDNNVSTSWTGNSSARTATFTYEIAKGTEPDHLELVAANGSAPDSFLIERSADGKAWQDLIAYSGEVGWAAGEKRRYPFTRNVPAQGEHKFWRVAVDLFNVNEGVVAEPGFAELAFKDAAGAVLSSGGTATVSYKGRTSSGATLLDGNLESGFSGDTNGTTVPVQVSYEFRNPVSVASVDLAAGSRAASLRPGPRALRIESSDDGKAWTVRAAYRGQGGWTTTEVRNFPVPNAPRLPGEHPFWRLLMHSSNTTEAVGALAEVRMFTASGEEVSAKGVGIGSSQRSSTYRIHFATDRRDVNYWLSAPSDTAPWIGFELPRPAAIETVTLRGALDNSPRDFSIQWSDDGSTWTTASRHPGNGQWGDKEDRSYPVFDRRQYPADHYRFWRVSVENTADPTWKYLSINEIQWRDAAGTSLTGKGVPYAPTVEDANNKVRWAFDGATGGNRWDDDKTSSWVTYEFPQPVRPAVLAMFANDDYAPKDFRIERSSDGVNWGAESRYRGQGGWKSEWREFKVVDDYVRPAGHHQWWRIKATRHNGEGKATQYLTVNELAFRRAGQPLQEGKGFGFASSEYSNGYKARLAFDGSLSYYWSTPQLGAAGVALPQWIAYEYPRPVLVDEVHITSHTDGNIVRDFDIEHSDDGETWTRIERYENSTNWQSRETRIFPIPKPTAPEGHGYGYRVEITALPQFAGHVNPSRAVVVEDIAFSEKGVVQRFVGAATAEPAVAGQNPDLAFDQQSWTSFSFPNWANMKLMTRFALPFEADDFTAKLSPNFPCVIHIRMHRVDENGGLTLITTKQLDFLASEGSTPK